MDKLLRRSIILKATLAKINQYRANPITYLKPKQTQCILHAAEGNDVLCILPTGYGKSLILKPSLYISTSMRWEIQRPLL